MIKNHYAAKLSELDMKVVQSIPPGGNWKNIPLEIPSRRLEQIRKSYLEGKGSRSTYYGRLLPDMPSYTINTYFNRPGNGCHIHYNQDRTLSQREAARLQSFPDSFEFIGPHTAINNQIGNAVPPLLAYQIAKSLPIKGAFVDLFSGAGGLALGFLWAGWTPIIANDIDEAAIKTHQHNIRSKTVCGDINNTEVHQTIVQAVGAEKAKHPDVPVFVIGGPPCQGFSTANTRRGESDKRNWLFKAYASILSAIRPDGFIFENVIGITNLGGGEFFKMIKTELEQLVETIKVNRVNAAEFAIPQRRERVIILGGTQSIVDNFKLTPITEIVKGNDTLGLLPKAISVKEALDDLPPIVHSQDGSTLDYRSEPLSTYQAFLRGDISVQEYISSFHRT